MSFIHFEWLQILLEKMHVQQLVFSFIHVDKSFWKQFSTILSSHLSAVWHLDTNEEQDSDSNFPVLKFNKNTAKHIQLENLKWIPAAEGWVKHEEKKSSQSS